MQLSAQRGGRRDEGAVRVVEFFFSPGSRYSYLAASLPARGLERGVAVNVAAGKVVRFISALNIPEDDLGEAVDIVLDLVAD